MRVINRNHEGCTLRKLQLSSAWERRVKTSYGRMGRSDKEENMAGEGVRFGVRMGRPLRRFGNEWRPRHP